MASHEEHLKAEFAKVIRHSVDDALNGTRKSNTAMYEATSYIVQVARTLNTTAIRVVSNEGDDAVCSSVFDDALAVSYDFAAIFVEVCPSLSGLLWLSRAVQVLDRASDRISFAWPCDAIAAIASRSLGVFSDVLALVCNNRRVQLEVIVNSSISALVASHAEVINAALELAAPGGPVGQLTVRKTDTRLEAAITTDTMIPVPMTV